jgi:hypothetical protein
MNMYRNIATAYFLRIAYCLRAGFALVALAVSGAAQGGFVATFDNLPTPPALDGTADFQSANGGSSVYGGITWAGIDVYGDQYRVDPNTPGPLFGIPHSGHYYVTNEAVVDPNDGHVVSAAATLTTTKVLTGAWFGRNEYYGFGGGADQITISALSGDTPINSPFAKVVFDLPENNPGQPEPLSFVDTSSFGSLSGITGYSIDYHPAGDQNFSYSWVADDFQFSSSGSGIGDPHMKTFSGQKYDFQAVGEFVLTRSTRPGDDFEVQVRTRLLSEHGHATFFTQAAAQVEDQRVTFDAERAKAGGSFIWVDGLPVALDRGDPPLELDGGKIVRLSDKRYEVRWDTGRRLYITDGGGYVNVSATLSPEDQPGSVEGLLGDDSDAPLPFSSKRDLYGAFADAWRITQETSLFDYVGAQTTATFTDKYYPLRPSYDRYLLYTAGIAAAAAVPEPGTFALAALGLAALGRKRCRKASA